MRHHNTLSKKIKLAETVKGGQLVSWSGHLANTGTAGKAPAGVALYDGVADEIIAVMVVGLIDVAATGVALGDGIKAVAGVATKVATGDAVFAVVSEINTAKSAEILLK